LQMPKEMNLDVVGVYFIRENRKDNSFKWMRLYVGDPY
jgi:hypothetical protein